MRHKIAIYGAGNVGATTAHYLSLKAVGDLVLYDPAGQIAAGKALDIQQSAPILGFDIAISGSNDPSIIANANIVIVSAGVPRQKDPKTGLYPSRDELLKTNKLVVEQASENIKKFAPDSIVILVTNPLNAMCHIVKEVTGFPRERVIGHAGVLDSARYKTFIAMELSVSVKDVQGIVLGGHGDSMVPLPQHTSVGGVPVTELISEQRIEEIIKRTAHGGGEIVGLLGYSGYYAPAAGAAMMVEAILLDQKRIVPAAVYTEGEYGYEGLFIGLPVKLGCHGVEDILEMSLTETEKMKLDYSANEVHSLVELLSN